MMSQTDMELGVSAPVCLCVLHHTQINVHGCPATVTEASLVYSDWTNSTAMGTGHYIVVVERMYGTDCASRFVYLQTCHSFCALHMYAVGCIRFTVFYYK